MTWRRPPLLCLILGLWPGLIAAYFKDAATTREALAAELERIFGREARSVRVIPNSRYARLHWRCRATTRPGVILLAGVLFHVHATGSTAFGHIGLESPGGALILRRTCPQRQPPSFTISFIASLSSGHSEAAKRK